jgi:hypothetical protein
MPTHYEKSLKSVAEKKHVLVEMYQFQKVERSGGQQWWSVRNLVTGEDKKVNDKSREYEKLRELQTNKLIWADTLEEQSEEEKEADAQASEKEDELRHGGGGGGSAVAALPKSRKINREFNLAQQQSILTEVLFGKHLDKKNVKISPYQRNVYGNNGVFFCSVTATVNAPEGVFQVAPAVQDTVKFFVETSVIQRAKWLESKYGPQYMERMDWDVYDGASDEDQGEEESDEQYSKRIKLSKQKHSIVEMLDALIYGSFDAAEGSKKATSAYTDVDDKTVSKVAGGQKRPRVEHFEQMKPKPTSAVAQLGAKQDELSNVLQSLATMLAVPVAAAAPMPVQASSAPLTVPFDEELLPLLESLKKLAPGTTTVCKTLAQSLGNYGVLSVQELLDMGDANAGAVLKDLGWSPLQIEKVLRPK